MPLLNGLNGRCWNAIFGSLYSLHNLPYFSFLEALNSNHVLFLNISNMTQVSNTSLPSFSIYSLYVYNYFTLYFTPFSPSFSSVAGLNVDSVGNSSPSRGGSPRSPGRHSFTMPRPNSTPDATRMLSYSPKHSPPIDKNRPATSTPIKNGSHSNPSPLLARGPAAMGKYDTRSTSFPKTLTIRPCLCQRLSLKKSSALTCPKTLRSLCIFALFYAH